MSTDFFCISQNRGFGYPQYFARLSFRSEKPFSYWLFLRHMMDMFYECDFFCRDEIQRLGSLDNLYSHMWWDDETNASVLCVED